MQLRTTNAGAYILVLSCLISLAQSFDKSKTITVSDSKVLQWYLCGTNDKQVLNNTVLELVLPSYVLNASMQTVLDI